MIKTIKLLLIKTIYYLTVTLCLLLGGCGTGDTAVNPNGDHQDITPGEEKNKPGQGEEEEDKTGTGGQGNEENKDGGYDGCGLIFSKSFIRGYLEVEDLEMHDFLIDKGVGVGVYMTGRPLGPVSGLIKEFEELSARYGDTTWNNYMNESIQHVSVCNDFTRLDISLSTITARTALQAPPSRISQSIQARRPGRS